LGKLSLTYGDVLMPSLARARHVVLSWKAEDLPEE